MHIALTDCNLNLIFVNVKDGLNILFTRIALKQKYIWGDYDIFGGAILQDY